MEAIKVDKANRFHIREYLLWKSMKRRGFTEIALNPDDFSKLAVEMNFTGDGDLIDYDKGVITINALKIIRDNDVEPNEPQFR